MQTFHTISDLRSAIWQRRRQGETIAFVPTMGNLHEGHMELVRVARQQADCVVASIFVNPLQFGANEDFDSYPKTLQADSEKLISNGCDQLFAPSVSEMYPDGQPIATQVSVTTLAKHHCGASRPGHFEGVATVVAKLFAMVQPDIAVFGEKDFQQLAVIRQMTRDLSFPVEIIGVPTQRSPEGLALSSRNSYLTETELATAPVLHQLLQRTKDQILAGETDFAKLRDTANQQLTASGFIPDYFNISRQHDLEPASTNDKDIVILAAAKLGQARLIDNITLSR